MSNPSGDGTALPPNPGSEAAIARGCICPVMDNAHGKGWLGREGLWVYTVGCPVHEPRTPVQSEDSGHG